MYFITDGYIKIFGSEMLSGRQNVESSRGMSLLLERIHKNQRVLKFLALTAEVNLAYKVCDFPLTRI